MKDFISQLLELAIELQESAPDGTQDANKWMASAGHFADVCLVDGRLVPELSTAIPLNAQESFLRATKAIKATSGAYNVTLRPNIDNGLAVIVKTLRREAVAEGGAEFSIRSLIERGKKLSWLQKQILDMTWNDFRETGTALAVRSIQPLIGKQSLRKILIGLNGSDIFEDQVNNTKCLVITIYGAFQTGHGNSIANLLVESLEFAKRLYERDNLVKEFDSVAFAKKFGDDSAKLLFRLLRMQIPARFPFHYSGGAADGSTWNVRIDDEIMDLYQADDITGYLDQLFAVRYDENEPIMYEDRMKRHMSTNAVAFAEPQIPWRIQPPERGNDMLNANYIDRSRLDELRAIKNGRFDCTRLVVMCEELNECASRRNAHAVIMLTRAIVDHVPPVFGYKSFDQVAANYGGNKERSFKKVLDRLDKHTKEVAHRLLHGQISDKEVAPTMAEVNYAGELNHLLSEVYRRLKH